MSESYARMRRRLRAPKSKLLWHGFQLVRLHEHGTREAIRFWRDGNLVAIIQKNGNIGLSGTNIFDHVTMRSELRAAKCLLGLKLVSPEFVKAHQGRLDVEERGEEIESAKMELERIGVYDTHRAAVAELKRNLTQLLQQGMSDNRHAEMLGYLAVLDPGKKPK